jgi:hypothetical protein
LVIAVKLADGVIWVVLLASLPNPASQSRARLVRPLNVLVPKPFDASTSTVWGFENGSRSRRSVFPAPTVNFHSVAATSVRELKLIVKTVPIALLAFATNRQTPVVTPSSAAPVGLFVFSPSLVHVPLPPVTLVISLLSWLSIVALLESATMRMA